ncbi:MAG TPA: heme lyase CcmF/NrfE family subunit [Rhizomicrobium sp.]|nr:heme lyase CcmF/NrfE family subunit [Rhizomicrobium sp.]
MTGEIGQLALSLALALAVVQAMAGLIGSRAGGSQAAAIATSSAFGLFVFAALAMGSLIFAFALSDFSILDVAQNSHTAKPLLYKLTGAWGNHEGSMVLWVFVLAVYSALIAFTRRGGERMTSAALGVQGLIAVAFLLFILLTSNPFVRLDPPPFEGAGLNPLLQDPGLAFHPPTLYVGYVGLSAAFAYAAAALITGDADAAWARAARPFVLIAWIALTLGIAGGSWWAYYTLGWGGFWFWDPVENASLMPWLIATALLHSALATERTGAFRVWTLLLSIIGFSLSLVGTFLVRSGVLTSVHAFANDPERGKFILGILVLAIGGALALFAWRAPRLQTGSAFDIVSRETALLSNNVLLTAAAGVVFLGTIYPLALDALTGHKLSVGAPYFAATFAPIFVGLMLLVPFGPRLGWRRGDIVSALRILLPVGIAAVVGAIVVLAIVTPRSLAGAGAIGLGVWVIGASVVDAVRRNRERTFGWSAVASALAHAGLGITLLGIAGTTVWRSEAMDVLGLGDSLHVAGYDLRLRDIVAADGPNYFAKRAEIDVSRNGASIATLEPETRSYPAEGQAKAETAIRTTGFSDLYVALGDERGKGRWLIRAYVNPLAPLIWLGGGVMALGGLASLFARLRVRALAPQSYAAAE